MNNRRRKTSLTKYIPLTLLQGFERVVQGLRVRGSWRTNIAEIFWPQGYGRQRYVFLFLQGCSTGGQGPTLLSDDFLYCILSAFSLDPNSSGPKWPLRPDMAFPITSCLQQSATQPARRTQLSYIIVRRPLDLWNRKFNRHQAETTVMQFRGHSLPVHHSVVTQRDLHLVPYYQPQSAHAISFDYWPLECVTSFQCITLE